MPPPPPLNPATRQPLTADDLAPIFPMALIEQEVGSDSGWWWAGWGGAGQRCCMHGVWKAQGWPGRHTLARRITRCPPTHTASPQVSLERYIDIPAEVREVYKLWRCVRAAAWS